MAVDDTHTISDEDIEMSIASLMERLPAPVRTFVSSQERKDIVLALSQKYQLHVDQAGIFEHSFLFMLLGASTPTEFVAELRAAGIADSVVTSITNDLNEQVFKKLRKEEEMMRPEPAAVQAPVPQPAPVAPPVQAAPAIPEPPPLETMRTMGTDMTRAQQAAPTQYAAPYMPSYPQMPVQYVPFPGSYQPMPQPQTYWVPVQMPAAPQYPYPQPQYAPPVATPPPPVVQQQPAPTQPAPVAQIAPEPTPVVPEVVAPARPMPPPPQDLPTTQSSMAPAPTPLHKEYGVDPYHEPIQ